MLRSGAGKLPRAGIVLCPNGSVSGLVAGAVLLGPGISGLGAGFGLPRDLPRDPRPRHRRDGRFQGSLSAAHEKTAVDGKVNRVAR